MAKFCMVFAILLHSYRCYTYVKHRGKIAWLEANIACRDKYGGYLASFNTHSEWNGVTAALKFKRSHFQYLVGLRTALSQRPHV